MATSIYFTESKDFKLIREKILNHVDEYLVYVYADTSNIKIPKELIKELPIYGNNLIWVDTAKIDQSQLVNHVILTIGQYLSTDEPIEFYITSKTSKFDKALDLLHGEGVIAELIRPDGIESEKKKTGRRGRPKGSTNKTTKPATAVKKADVSAAPKKRGRPPKKKVEKIVATKPKAKRGRPKKTVIVDEAIQVAKTKKPRKQRVEKSISKKEVGAKLMQFPSKDGDVELMQKKLFSVGKVKRPKFDIKLSEMIQTDLAIGVSEADSLIVKMKETGMMDNSGKGGRLMYKD